MALSIVKCETFIAYWRKLLVTRVREKGVSKIPHAESRIGSPIGPGAGRFPPSDAYKSSLGILMVGWICALVIGGEVVKGSLAYRIRSLRRRGWDRPAPGLPRSGPHVRGRGSRRMVRGWCRQEYGRCQRAAAGDRPPLGPFDRPVGLVPTLPESDEHPNLLASVLVGPEHCVQVCLFANLLHVAGDDPQSPVPVAKPEAPESPFFRLQEGDGPPEAADISCGAADQRVASLPTPPPLAGRASRGRYFQLRHSLLLL